MEKVLPEGIKWTNQRKEVYKILSEAKKPLSANEIYHKILSEQGNDGSNFAVSTVYRSLGIFEEKQLVEKSVLPGGDVSVYELKEGKHRHYAVCLSCHKLVALKDCPFEHVKEDAIKSEEGDFVITGHKLELYGYCRECKINS